MAAHVHTACRYTVDYVNSNDSTANLNPNRLRERFEDEEEDETSAVMAGAEAGQR